MLNLEQNYLSQCQKFHTSSSSVNDNFLNNLLHNSFHYHSKINLLLVHSLENKLDLVPAISYVLKNFIKENRDFSGHCMDSLTNFIIKNYDEINFLEDTHIKDIALTPISRSFITDTLFTSCVFNKVKMVSLMSNIEEKKRNNQTIV